MIYECETCKIQFKLQFHINNHMKTNEHLKKTKNTEYIRKLCK